MVGWDFITTVDKPVITPMSVIVELTLTHRDCELGSILALEEGQQIALETVVPLGDCPVPFITIAEEHCDTFESRVDEHPRINDVVEVDQNDGTSLYAVDWESSTDQIFESLLEADGQIIGGATDASRCTIRLSFRSYDAFATFEKQCREADFDFHLERLYNPTRPDAGRWYGLTARQRETLIRAVKGGYYSIPRGISTEELADEFGISDQAITERLRRAIHTLTMNTLLVDEFED